MNTASLRNNAHQKVNRPSNRKWGPSADNQSLRSGSFKVGWGDVLFGWRLIRLRAGQLEIGLDIERELEPQ